MARNPLIEMAAASLPDLIKGQPEHMTKHTVQHDSGWRYPRRLAGRIKGKLKQSCFGKRTKYAKSGALSPQTGIANHSNTAAGE